MFAFSKCWPKDASSVKTLAYDGWFISLYSVEIVRKQLTLRDEVKREVPSSWDSAALAGYGFDDSLRKFLSVIWSLC